MKPSKEDIIYKYKQEAKTLKTELAIVYRHLIEDEKGKYPDLLEIEFEMMKKGFKIRKLEIESHLNKIHLNIGKLLIE